MRQGFMQVYAAPAAIASLLFAVSLLFAAGLLLAGRAGAEDGARVQDGGVPAVKVVTAEAAGAFETRSFFGRVRARETVDLSFEVGGRLEILDAVEGDRVDRGSPLARLDQAPFKRAVERAEVTLRQENRRFERAAKLMQSSAGSRVRLEDAETSRDLAAVALREARDDLEDATILAPFDGLVAERLTPNFTNVEPGRPILRLHDMSEVRVELDLPERLLIQAGDPAQIRFMVRMPDQDGAVAVRFVEFHAQTDRVGQSYIVTLAFPDAKSVFLVPGASVTVIAELPAPKAGLVLPASALLIGPERNASVLVLETSEGGLAGLAVLRRQPVDVRSRTGTRFLVTGLPEGAEVVAVGGHLLREGQAVRRYTRLVVEER